MLSSSSPTSLCVRRQQEDRSSPSRSGGGGGASSSEGGKKKKISSNKKRGMAYNNVRYEGKIGKLLFNHRRLSFLPRDDSDTTTEKDQDSDDRLSCRLSWEDVGFIEKTPSSSNANKRHKLKITSCFDNQVLIFQTSTREKLNKIFDEAHERLDEFHTYHEKKQQQLFISSNKNNKIPTTPNTTTSRSNSTTKSNSIMKKNNLRRLSSLPDRRDNTWNDTSLNWDEGSAFVDGDGDDWLNDSSSKSMVDWLDSSSSLREGSTRTSSSLLLGESLSHWNISNTKKSSASNPFYLSYHNGMKDEKDDEEEEDDQDQEEEEFSDDDPEEDDAPNTVEIEDVTWEGNQGRLVLQEDSVIFLEQDSKRCLFTLSWDQVRKHSCSSSASSSSSTSKKKADKNQKILLRLYVDDETYEGFELSTTTTKDRLALLKQDINRLQAAFLVNKFIPAAASSNPTIAKKETSAAEKWKPDDHHIIDDATLSTHDMSSSDHTDPWASCFPPPSSGAAGGFSSTSVVSSGRRGSVSLPCSPKNTRATEKGNLIDAKEVVQLPSPKGESSRRRPLIGDYQPRSRRSSISVERSLSPSPRSRHSSLSPTRSKHSSLLVPPLSPPRLLDSSPTQKPSTSPVSPVSPGGGRSGGRASLNTSPKKKKTKGAGSKDMSVQSPTNKKVLTSPKKGNHADRSRRSRKSRSSSLRLPLCPPPPLLGYSSPTKKSTSSTIGTTIDSSYRSADGDNIVDFDADRSRRSRKSRSSSLRLPLLGSLSPTKNSTTTIGTAIDSSYRNTDGDNIVDIFIQKADKLLHEHHQQPPTTSTTTKNKLNLSNHQAALTLTNALKESLSGEAPQTSAATIVDDDGLLDTSSRHSAKGNWVGRRRISGGDNDDGKKEQDEVRAEDDDRFVNLFILKAKKLMKEHSSKKLGAKLGVDLEEATDSIKRERRGRSGRQRRSIC